MRDWETETTTELCCRADEAITVSRELAAQARANVERALSFLQQEAYVYGASRRRFDLK